jgi:pre-mRNA-splicing factor CWC26
LKKYLAGKKEEKLMKYMEWGKGLVQKKERESQLEQDLYEAEKPMARYKNDRDLEEHLKKVEREDDPMAEYIRSKEDTLEPGSQKPKPKYRGPPAPPNRYGILPGARWDGVDRSNGFEKRFYESLNAKKARAEEAYKWSVEDM